MAGFQAGAGVVTAGCCGGCDGAGDDAKGDGPVGEGVGALAGVGLALAAFPAGTTTSVPHSGQRACLPAAESATRNSF